MSTEILKRRGTSSSDGFRKKTEFETGRTLT